MAKREEIALDRLTLVEVEAVEEFVEAIYHHFSDMAAQIVLFGSKARGESHAGSDIDVLVVVRREDWRLSNAISTLAARISYEHDVLLGPVVIGQERWERMGREKFSLYRNIAWEGKVILPPV